MTTKHGKAKHDQARAHRGEHEREVQREAAEQKERLAHDRDGRPVQAPPRDEPDAAAKLEKVRQLIDGIEIAMLTVVEEGVPRSLPMYTQKNARFDGSLWFLTSRSSRKVHDIEDDARVGLSYADPRTNRYVSVSGRATVLRDQAKIDELWSPLYLAWWPAGREDPDLALLKVEVDRAEYWDAPEGRLAQVIGFAKAVLTGQPYQPGENEELELH